MMTFKLMRQNQYVGYNSERTMYITKQYKDTLKKTSMILMSFCNTFIRVYVYQ